jgi:hypothetical protein
VGERRKDAQDKQGGIRVDIGAGHGNVENRKTTMVCMRNWKPRDKAKKKYNI